MTTATTFNNGRIAQGMPEAEYRAAPGWSISQGKLLPDHPELFDGFFISKRFEFEETAGMLLGTNCHAEFLDGKHCCEAPAYALTSNGQRRGKAWKAYRDSHAALERLSAKEMAVVQGIRRSVESQPRLADLLWGKGETELPLFAVDPETKLPIKGKLDKLRVLPHGLVLCDFKVSTVDPDDERMLKTWVHAMGYVKQLAFYCDLVEACYDRRPDKAVLLVGQAKAPFVARAWSANPNDLDWGRRRNREWLDDLRRRMDSGDWVHGEHHNEINAAPDGSLLPSYVWGDARGTARNRDGAYSEFDAFGAAVDAAAESFATQIEGF